MKKNASTKKDQHKPGRQVRVRKSLIDQLDILAERRASTPPDEVNRAVREMLEREHLWPPPPPAK